MSPFAKMPDTTLPQVILALPECTTSDDTDLDFAAQHHETTACSLKRRDDETRTYTFLVGVISCPGFNLHLG